MKVWLIAVLLAVAVTAAVAEADKAVTDAAVTPGTRADAKTKEDDETSGKDDEDGGSNESSSEENNEENDEGKTEVKTCGATTTHKPVATSTKPKPSTPAYVKPTKEVVTPIYRPAVTTEAPKTSTVYSTVKPEAPKYVKPTIVEVTTPKYVPISFEKPVATPAVTIRKSGWVRAPGYKLGYARAESSNPAVIEPIKYTAPSAKVSETVVMKTKSEEKPSVPRQVYPKWFFKTKSTGN
ncbi:hypothetical protein GHT06_020926 [Daphnia sinensis]|uniref:Uncharacterized protein n=1 Tax=Daphnia sinensis TaxID=1820382 RepID=A0AAD5PNA8_9CRUS|nr:hypothetical protein GHT06_020926 [Daphnia sinensis]